MYTQDVPLMMDTLSLVLRLPGTRHHDVIKTVPKFMEQKGSVLHIIQPTSRSTLGVYDIRPSIARYV